MTETGVGMENFLAQYGQPEKSKATEKRCILDLSSKRAVVNLILLAVFVESASTQLLSDGVMVAHGPLEAIVMVRIHVGQPLFSLPVWQSFLGAGSESTPFAGGRPELVSQHFQTKTCQLSYSQPGSNVRDIIGADAAQRLVAGLPGMI